MSVRLAYNLKLLAQHTAGGAPNLGMFSLLSLSLDTEDTKDTEELRQSTSYADGKHRWQIPCQQARVCSIDLITNRSSAGTIWTRTQLLAK